MRTTIALVLLLLGAGCADTLDDKSSDEGWTVDESDTNQRGDSTDPDQWPDGVRDTTPDVEPKPDTDPEPDVEPDVEPDPDPGPWPSITSAFISGHLGSYWDCPDEGYTPDGDAGGAGADEAGACFAEDADGCLLNCEGAQLTILVSNVQELPLENVRITRLDLLDADREVVAERLPIISVVDENGEEAHPTLQQGEEVRLRIDYRGPAYPYELLGSHGYGFLAITIEADHAESDVLGTSEVYVLPSIAT